MQQSYLVPTPDGWALNSFGFEDIDDDEIVPLPLGWQVSYLDACSFVHNLPYDWHLVDGWETAHQLAELEPTLALRIADLYRKVGR